MPHITVEYTANIENDARIPSLLRKINQTLAETDIFPMGGIRTRAIKITEYAISDDKEDDAFVHVMMKIGSGRPEKVKKQVCDSLFNIMEHHFTKEFQNRYIALSMELYEFPFPTYKKNNIHRRFQNK
ncbi:MAG TPA: 5-carboxymethyl-2-hydroxymuconate Delta-isomerase [Virgibacillus sp.]|nr:5-carboxymethyl-2-hydroxymuconate Delta-isomerase [Virgibacillus sp.]